MYNYLLYFDIKTDHTLFTSSSVLNETCMYVMHVIVHPQWYEIAVRSMFFLSADLLISVFYI